MPGVSNELRLSFGVLFEDLYSRDGLVRLDAIFQGSMKTADRSLYDLLVAARANPGGGTDKERSDLIIELAPHVEDFIGELFGIAAEVRALQARHTALAPLFAFKRKFI